MQVRPHQWTHHHTHRLFHLSVFLSFVAIICSVIAGQLLVWVQTNADEVVSLSAVVAGINDNPPTEVTTGSSASPDFPSVIPQRPLADHLNNSKGVFVTVDMAAADAVYKTDGKTSKPYWLINTQYPRFIGLTSVPNTTVYIEIRSPLEVTATVRSDDSGAWSWVSPVPLSVGKHTATFAVSNLDNPPTFSGLTIDFVIDLSDGEETDPTVPFDPVIINGGGPDILFDVQVRILEQFKVIDQGHEVAARVRLINFGSAGSPVDVTVHYLITDENDKVISHTTETVAVATRLSMLKTFQTVSNFPPGRYSLIVNVPSTTITATATDIFEVRSSVVPIAATSSKFPSPEVLLVILLIVFVVFAYIELHQIAGLSQEIAKLRHPELKSK